MKGWIALDIDGTITNTKDSVPKNVINFLHKAYADGWSILLSTGRAVSFAKSALDLFPFPFYLSAQNGSIVLEMPSEKIFCKNYMKGTLIRKIEEVECEFIVYSGFEKGDFCYYRPKSLKRESLEYLQAVQKREKKMWVEVEQFSMIETTPLVKCFGRLDQLKEVGSKLYKSALFQLSLIRDPFNPSYHLLMISDGMASKGASLKELIKQKGRGMLVIAGGDDENDLSLLREADLKIAMPQGSEKLRSIADFIAPPVAEQGIIEALKIAIKKWG